MLSDFELEVLMILDNIKEELQAIRKHKEVYENYCEEESEDGEVKNKKADFDLRENMELARTLKEHANNRECPEDVRKLMLAASARLVRTTKHLEFWLEKQTRK